MRLDPLSVPLIFVSVRLSLTRHSFDFFLAHAARSRDRDLLLFCGGQILRGYIDNSISVNVESHLNLRNSARRRRDAHQKELAQWPVVLSHGAFALEHMDLHRGLVIRRGRERLPAPRRDGRVALDELGEHAAQGLHPERQGRDVEQHHVAHVAGQHAALDGGAHGHHLVGIHPFVRFLTEQFADHLLDSRDSRGAAYQDNLVDIRRL